MTPSLVAGGGGGGVIISSTKPDYEEGKTWYDPDNGTYYVAADNGGGGGWHAVPPIQTLEETDAFDGANGESLSHDGTRVANGSVELGLRSGTTTTVDSDNTYSSSSWLGPEFNPNTALTEIRGRLQSNMGSVNEARVVRVSDGVVVGGPWNINATGGDYVRQTVSLSAGTAYTFEVRDSAGTTTANGPNGGPYTGTHLDTQNNGNRFGQFQQLTGYEDATSGSVTVSWPLPDGIDMWDLATFNHTLDSETVTIDILDGGGNVLFTDVSQNFDISTVSTSTQVQIRANIDRANTANNPRLDYAARRFVR